MKTEGGILLAAINAKWIHPSLALRLLKANLGPLEDRCAIIEFALRQPLPEKTGPLLAARPRILGFSVAIWNHAATLELLRALWNEWRKQGSRPVVVLGGPEVSFLPETAEIFRYADFCVRGEGEIAFRELCGDILNNVHYTFALVNQPLVQFVIPEIEQVNVNNLQSGYRLYTDEDLRKKLTYVEASRGCVFNCEFCMSAVQLPFVNHGSDMVNNGKLSLPREFPLDSFFAEMDDLISRGARTFKFLDRTFNLNIERARRIMEFFLNRIEEGKPSPFTVHFEMVPSRFPDELIETLARFPPGALRLEIGIQTLNPEVSVRIGRPSKPEKELETLRLLREKTRAIIHADLIAGLPGENMASFGRGFDRLWAALAPGLNGASAGVEIQLGILKLLPGAPIARYSERFGMRFNPLPPYELIESTALPARDMEQIKIFSRFWELIVNRGLLDAAAFSRLIPRGNGCFERFMGLSTSLFAHFGRDWGIDKEELRKMADH
jgi:radical SAM superfamily enzyme YgiQ (UPF0313 family)